jgi:hypothetical protein
LPLAALSLTNFAHIVLFAFFFVVTSAQFSMTTPAAYLGVATMTLVMHPGGSRPESYWQWELPRP